MATKILDAVSANGAGSGFQVTGPQSVNGYGQFGGATVEIQAARTDTEAEYSVIGTKGKLRGPGWVDVNIHGTYYIRAYVKDAVEALSPSITLETEGDA